MMIIDDYDEYVDAAAADDDDDDDDDDDEYNDHL